MAIWQHTIILVPSKNFDSNYVQFLKQKETGYLKETYFFWENCYLNIENISEKIDLNISEFKSKNDDYVGWKGNSENLQDNDCSISLSGEFIKEIKIRFDLRDIKNIKKFVDLLLEIANENQLKFMNLKYEFFNAEKDLLIQDIMNSNGIKFLKNPEGFFTLLSQN